MEKDRNSDMGAVRQTLGAGEVARDGGSRCDVLMERFLGEAQLVHSTCISNAILFEYGAVSWLRALWCSSGASLNELLHFHVPILFNLAIDGRLGLETYPVLLHFTSSPLTPFDPSASSLVLTVPAPGPSSSPMTIPLKFPSSSTY
jgi:hypothetical protein